MKISKRMSELLSGHDFQYSNFQRRKNPQNVGDVIELVFCISSDDHLYFFKDS